MTPPQPTEHRITEEPVSLLNKGMEYIEFEYETVHINLFFKTIGLQEFSEVLGGEINLQECAKGKFPERNTIVMNQHIEECIRIGLFRQVWILTVNILYDCTLLKNVKQVSGRMNIHCNTGTASINWVKYLEGFGTVCYHKEGITNILSLA